MSDIERIYNQLKDLKRKHGPDKVKGIMDDFFEINPKWKRIYQEEQKLERLKERRDLERFEERYPEERSKVLIG